MSDVVQDLRQRGEWLDARAADTIERHAREWAEARNKEAGR